jgi:hypothetical protein
MVQKTKNDGLDGSCVTNGTAGCVSEGDTPRRNRRSKPLAETLH